MRKLIFVALLGLISTITFAQNSGNDSYTIQRLVIFNEKGEVLLEKHKNGWMTPALRHNTKTGTNEGLYNLASEFGLKISAPKLAGIFMFIPEYKPESSFRQHYISHVVSGKIKLPEGKLDTQWFTPNKAIEMMSLPETKLIFAIKDMTEQILNYQHIIWGGTFSLWKENGETKYKTTEYFYPIAKR